MNDFWIVLTGVLVAVNCGLLGVFLILRRAAMTGDALSHAVLPGIAAAYLLSGSRHSAVMLIGAALTGWLTAFLIEWLKKKIRLQNDASIGITFTFLFAVGVILISAFSGNIDLDLDCVLYGDIAYVPLERIYAGSRDLGPAPAWLLGGNLVPVTALVTFGYRGLLVTTFDPGFARGIGIASGGWHYLLMGAVSLTVVLSFSAVGAILVTAFLTVPPATAYLLSKRLVPMIWLTVLFGVVSAVGGFLVALWQDTAISASMAVVSGVIFAAVFILLRVGKLRKQAERSRLNFSRK